MSCPICANDTVQKYRPFCSRRCADIDLAKWMSGSYATPAADQEGAPEALEQAFGAVERREDKLH